MQGDSGSWLEHPFCGATSPHRQCPQRGVCHLYFLFQIACTKLGHAVFEVHHLVTVTTLSWAPPRSTCPVPLGDKQYIVQNSHIFCCT